MNFRPSTKIKNYSIMSKVSIWDIVYFFFVGYVNDFLFFFLEKIGILDGDTEFENSEEIYEAIGHILHEIAAEKSEDDIK